MMRNGSPNTNFHLKRRQKTSKEYWDVSTVCHFLSTIAKKEAGANSNVDQQDIRSRTVDLTKEEHP